MQTRIRERCQYLGLTVSLLLLVLYPPSEGWVEVGQKQLVSYININRSENSKDATRDMMKTLVVAVVVLSLTSVCQPAPLACDKLLKQADKSPDLSGRWYLIAMSSDICLIPAILNTLFWPSVAMDITAQETPNVYNGSYNINMYGYCTSEAELFLFANNTIFDVDENNSPNGESEVLLQTGCADCIVVKGEEAINTLLLFSRRKTATAAELKEFEAQTECLGWSKPQILNTDHEYENCKTLDDSTDVDSSELCNLMYQRVKNTYSVPFKCFTESLIHDPHAAYDWAQQKWNSLW
ncbi:uncharacterized protein LOC113155049 [Anabas testudineus]|uniref:uncharacterized protein LOC113155049 n=1 Tax=Anabas testudineus TaxID=64144 RepID=UPI000E456A2A|nr:uncharacterized protein LOC113155049 [Anabas testudineus]